MVDTLGRWEYTVEAWVDRFATWRDELSKKFAAGLDVTSELLEGAWLDPPGGGTRTQASRRGAGAPAGCRIGSWGGR